MKLLSLFSGIGSFEKSLDRLNIDYELVNYCEVDKYASCAYSAIHNVSEDKNLWDVSKVDTSELEGFDLMTYGFPCTDISLAGKQKGLKKDSGTKSSLLWESMRILKNKKPKYAIAENVKNLVGSKFINDFNEWLDELNKLGYNNYWKVLNSKDFGVPQNRERVFVVSIRKDMDDGSFKMPISPAENQMSLFRNVEEYENDVEFKVLKDILEDKVNEKYYLSDEYFLNIKLTNKVNGKIKQVAQTSNEGSQAGKVYDNEDIFPTVCAETHGYAMGYIDDKEPVLRKNGVWKNKDNELTSRQDANYYKFPDNHGARTGVLEKIVCEQRSDEGLRFFDGDYCGTIRTIDSGGDKRVLELWQVGDIKDGELELNLNGSYSQGARIHSENGASCTLSAEGGGGGAKTGLYMIEDDEGVKCIVSEATKKGYDIAEEGDSINIQYLGSETRRGRVQKQLAGTLQTSCNQATVTNYRIRRLTPLECFRLQDFDDEDYYKTKKALEDKFYNGRNRSDSRCYKFAGNSITVKVLEKIFEQLFF